MASKLDPQITNLRMTVRFVQGYRYLDRCGDALIRLENALDEHWLHTEISPKSGTIKNPALGMHARFGSDSVQIEQEEFISIDHFIDQSCKIFEILCATFDIRRIVTPSVGAILQVSVTALEQAEEHIRTIRVADYNPSFTSLMDGDISASRIVICTEQDDVEIYGLDGKRRQRIEIGSVTQIKPPDFDNRLLQRVALMPKKDQGHLKTLMKFREGIVIKTKHALQVELEDSVEGEFDVDCFDVSGFQSHSIKWVEKVSAWLKEKLAGK